MRTRSRVLLAAVCAVLALPGFAIVALNVWLNVGLPERLNEKPERLRVDYTYAWMVWPGTVHAGGLTVRSQGPRDQWVLHVGSATADVDLRALATNTLILNEPRGRNARFAYRHRLVEGEAPRPFHPPIAGLDNPPAKKPEVLYPRGIKWTIRVEGAEVRDVEEVWIDDYRYTGPASIAGDVSVTPELIRADIDLALAGGDTFRGDSPLTHTLQGTISLELAGLEPRATLNTAVLDAVRIRADLDTAIASFDFLDYYLEKAPWLRLEGSGRVAIGMGLYAGRLSSGSTFEVVTEDLSVRFLGYRVTGDAVIRGEVAAREENGEPESHVELRYGGFDLAEDDTPPLVTGAGFSVVARSPDVALDQPFTQMTLVIDLPRSEVPDFARFATYLPDGVGFELLGGAGTVRAHMDAEIPSDRATGDLHLDGTDVRGRFDGLLLAADIGMHAHLVQGSLTERRYDFSGSSLAIGRLELRDPEVPGPLLVGEERWTAEVTADRGIARVGAKTFLDADISLTCTNSVPFVAIVARSKPLAPWVQKLLSIPDVRGSARLSLGNDSVNVRGLEIRGGQFEVLLDWLRERKNNQATLFARYGVLSIGVGVDGTERTVQVFDARAWHARRTGAAPPIPPLPPGIERREERRDDRALRKAARQEGG